MTTSARDEPRVRHRLTRLGLHFAFVGGFAMLGGALRGLNLLLVLAGMMVGLLFMQWRLCRRSIESVSLRRRVPNEAFAGRPFRVRFRVTNHSRSMPAWMLRIDDPIGSMQRSDRSTASTGIGFLAAKRTATPSYDCVITRRGRYRLGPSTGWTTFPFALAMTRKTNDDQESLDVYPELLDLKRGWQRHLLGRTEGATAAAHRSGANDGEFFALREWQSGDNLRWIHWRTTARKDEPMVRQFEQHRRFDLCLLVDGYLPNDAPDELAEEPAELAISLAATLLTRLVASPANRLTLAVAAQRPQAVSGGSAAGKRHMLGLLSEMKTCCEPNLAEAIEKVSLLFGRAQDLVVLSPRSLEAAGVGRDDELSAALHPWKRGGRLCWINVTDPSVERWISLAGKPAAVGAE